MFAKDGDASALASRVAALEKALASAAASAGATGGDVAAAAAMTHLQEKVKALETAFSQRNATADAATAALSKVERLAAQVQKDAAAVPELQRQMQELRDAMAKTPRAARGLSTPTSRT